MSGIATKTLLKERQAATARMYRNNKRFILFSQLTEEEEGEEGVEEEDAGQPWKSVSVFSSFTPHNSIKTELLFCQWTVQNCSILLKSPVIQNQKCDLLLYVSSEGRAARTRSGPSVSQAQQ